MRRSSQTSLVESEGDEISREPANQRRRSSRLASATTGMGDKEPEAHDVKRSSTNTRLRTQGQTPHQVRGEDMEAKVLACIHTTKVLAGNDHHRL
ncbi:hypothetical protein E2C01_066801 [Portunus trituberculatus]|uniref:Uncharacterized protein n=1 Tax=Portunus trituberculatus TaxID=210409 RepID=A0A5B7HMI2_PORTR|nr:hypothetical protein [Portunus trituberculatus]